MNHMQVIGLLLGFVASGLVLTVIGLVLARPPKRRWPGEGRK